MTETYERVITGLFRRVREEEQEEEWDRDQFAKSSGFYKQRGSTKTFFVRSKWSAGFTSMHV